MVGPIRRLSVSLTLIALAVIAAACGGTEEPSAERNQTATEPAPIKDDGGAQRVLDVEITGDGLNPASAKVTVGGRIIFENTDSKPHTIVAPAGDEHLVKSGEVLIFKDGGCCAATFTDAKTGTELKVKVPEKAAGY